MNIIEQIASVCHEANAAYCRSLGDESQPTWDDAPQWQRDSAIQGVEFHFAHPDALASASHDNWLRQKRDDGWKWGPAKNPGEKKEHPCMVRFDELPTEQQVKDYIFRAIVHAFRESGVVPARILAAAKEDGRE